MHSTLVRAQNVFGFFTTVAFCIGALVALSVVISPQTPSATVELRNVQVVKGRPHYYSNKKEEYAHIKFDLDADFSSLFTWNTKQLFIYILASYPSTHASTPPSRAIIWDQIIPSPQQQHPYNPLTILGLSPSSSPLGPLFAKTPSSPPPGILHLPNTRPKYQITDISGRLARRENVTLEVGWNVQPWVGR
ncbi:MAG: signal peptidase subunit [Lasallia pustulata]|uniref:Signal peptidase subunit 3 n=1 Tax=Lasallia pustulata TaxID=136370 RepID=A0A5M8PVR5_9LECA|nr:MAG: signal peptidase subunit [Lasallia pustulata]